MTAVIIELPQRFQIFNGASPIGAGTRLLALTVIVSFGSGVSGSMIQIFNVAPFYILLGSSCLTTIGLVLLSTLSVYEHIEPASYGYQVILGLGIGASLGSSLLMIPMVVDKKDMGKFFHLIYKYSGDLMCVAVAMSSFFQARELGGALAIAICTNVLKDQTTSSLQNLLIPLQLDAILMLTQEIGILSTPSLQHFVRVVYAKNFNTQMKVMKAFSAAGIMATFWVWERPLRRAHAQT